MRKVWHGLKVHYPVPLALAGRTLGHLRDQGSGVQKLFLGLLPKSKG